MRKLIASAACAIILLAGSALAQTMTPATNTPLLGCVEGRALRIVNNAPACSTTIAPTVSSCGTGAAMSAQATDFVGQITTGTTLITTCVVTFSKLYASFGCLAQSNTSASAIAGSPVIGSAGGKTTMTISLTVALAVGKITYFCGPV